MDWSRQNIIPDIIRTGYDLRAFLPLLYFACSYVVLTLTSGISQIVLSFLSVILGLALLKLYVTRQRSNIITSGWRSVRVSVSLILVAILAVSILYVTGNTFIPFGSSLVSTLGLIAASKQTTPLKKTIVRVYPDGLTLYEDGYPFYIHFLYAITHERREYGNFTAQESMNNVLLSVSTEHQVGFICFESEEEYIDWLDDSRTVMACEMCHTDKECSGADAEIKGIYASDFNPSKMSVCNDCQDSITKKLINNGDLNSEKITASRI